MMTFRRAHVPILRRALLHHSPAAEQDTVMSSALPRRWTAGDVRAMPETPGIRIECVDGVLVMSPSPTFAHQLAVGFLFHRL